MARGKYRVCVYAICKNEEKFAKRWVDSMGEADAIYVLDTGSTDKTVSILREAGVCVTQEVIQPWRFDVARNKSLSIVPDYFDICVCTDIDEVFSVGWREKVEFAWNENVRRLRYRYVWDFNEDGSECTVFYLDNIHARHGFYWEHPVHETLQCNTPYNFGTVDGVQLFHYADRKKSRSQYLPLLKLSVKEAPEDDRNMHYLGREYMYYHMWDDCIETLQRHLSLPSATWKDERCASMRYIARAYEAKFDYDNARQWLLHAISEAPYLREPWLDAAMFAYRQKEWLSCIALCLNALKISSSPMTYISDQKCYGSLPYDLLSIAYYNIGMKKEAYEACATALDFSPNDERIKANLEFICNSI